MRFPPGLSRRNAAWPSHVSGTLAIALLSDGRGGSLARRTVRRRREASSVLVRSLPAALVLAALLADAAGAHGLAFYLVVTAVPAAGAATLVAVGERAEGGGRGHHLPPAGGAPRL